jgi:ABC-type multidrug transport system permease subunit
VHQPEPEHGRLIINIYYDNSQIITSKLYFNITKTVVQGIAYDKSTSALSEIWGKLSSIKTQLRGEVSRVDGFLEDLNRSEQRILSLNEKVKAINVTDMNTLLNKQMQRSGEIAGAFDEFTLKMDKYSASISSVKAELAESKDKLITYRASINNTIIKFEEYDATFAEVEANLEEIYRTSGGNVSSVEEALEEVQNARAEIRASIEQLKTARADIDSAITKIDSTEAELSTAEDEMRTAKNEIRKLDIMLSESSADIEEMNASVSALSETVEQVKVLISDALESKETVDANLTQSKALMQSFIGSLDELEHLDPEFLANPFIINEKTVLPQNKLSLMLPMVIAVIIMLTSILLTAVSFVTERGQGAYLRMTLSSTGKITFFSGKILGQIIFTLAESAIVILLATSVFGVPFTYNLINIIAALCAVSLVFVSMGLLLSNFTRQQSTTVLSALLLMIPLLFLSGIILPLEIMSPAIRTVASFLPLTVSTMLLSDIILKNTPLLSLIPEFLTLIVPSLAIIIFTIINKRLR